MDIGKTNRAIPHPLLKTAVIATVLALTACGTHNPPQRQLPSSARTKERIVPQAANKMMVMRHAEYASDTGLLKQEALNIRSIADTEHYQKQPDQPVKAVAQEPVSTFSIDVDTGSYANVRRFLNNGRLPPKDAVRIEEIVNYFPYNYPLPTGGYPFAVHTQTVDSPWQPEAKLIKIGIQTQDLAKKELPPANLVFLVDISGSMNSPEKLPLVKKPCAS